MTGAGQSHRRSLQSILSILSDLDGGSAELRRDSVLHRKFEL